MVAAEPQTAVVLGAGNVAHHLTPALESAGLTILAVASRKLSNAEKLCNMLQSKPAALPLTRQQPIPIPPADWVILAVPDRAIAELANQLIVPSEAILLHTSGATPLEQLGKSKKVGVLYPLQTFSQGKAVNFSEIPLLIEASSSDAFQKLQGLAHSLSHKVYPADSAARKKLHVAAVFACNFSNYLYGVAHELMEEEELPFSLLQPLLHETLAKALEISPKSAQTGPAIRNDWATMQAHEELLAHKPALLKLYRLLSEGIQKSV